MMNKSRPNNSRRTNSVCRRFPALLLSLAMALTLAVPASAADTAGPDAPFLYADQLDLNQRELFEELSELALSPNGAQVTVRLPEPIVYTADETGENKKADRRFSQIGQGALDAMLFDDPSNIWIDKGACTTSAGARGVSDGGGRYEWTISKLTMHVAAQPGAEQMSAALEAAVFAPQGETRYEQVKYLHDELCRRVDYVDTANARSPYGALVEGKAVCEGYAKAFKILCDRTGIPCVIVAGRGVTSKTGEEGENHMWNYVQMEDGKWYAVDATWDDQKGQICRDFFLVGAVTLSTKAFGSTTFAASHMPSGDFSRSGVVFGYPELNQKMYRPAK